MLNLSKLAAALLFGAMISASAVAAGKAFVTDQEEHVPHAAVLPLRQHGQPVLRRLAGAEECGA